MLSLHMFKYQPLTEKDKAMEGLKRSQTVYPLDLDERSNIHKYHSLVDAIEYHCFHECENAICLNGKKCVLKEALGDSPLTA